VLEVAQQGIATCLVSAGGQRVTEFMRLPETPCVVDGVRYRMARNGRSFTLEGPHGVLAVAERTRRRELTVGGAGQRLRMRRVGLLGGRWDLYAGEQLAGGCRHGVFSATAHLPEDLPLALRVFVLYTSLMNDGARFLPWVQMYCLGTEALVTHANAPLPPAGRWRLARCVLMRDGRCGGWLSGSRSRRARRGGRTAPRTELRIIGLRVTRGGGWRGSPPVGVGALDVHRVLTRHKVARLAHLDRVHVDIQKLGNIHDSGDLRAHGRQIGGRNSQRTAPTDPKPTEK